MVTQLVRNIGTFISDPGPPEPHTRIAAETEVRVGPATVPHCGMKGSQGPGEGKRGEIGCIRRRKERNQSPSKRNPNTPIFPFHTFKYFEGKTLELR